MKIIKKLCPDIIFSDIYKVDEAFLKEHGICGLILDIDNTMVPFKTEVPDDNITEYVKKLSESGIKLAILSNNKEGRVAKFSEPLGISSVHKAGKPRKKYYRAALKNFGLKPQQVAVVGDQLFTDIYGGKRVGMLAVLVPPINEDTDWFIKLKRRCERIIMRRALGTGCIAKGDYDTFYYRDRGRNGQ